MHTLEWLGELGWLGPWVGGDPRGSQQHVRTPAEMTEQARLATNNAEAFMVYARGAQNAAPRFDHSKPYIDPRIETTGLCARLSRSDGVFWAWLAVLSGLSLIWFGVSALWLR